MNPNGRIQDKAQQLTALLSRCVRNEKTGCLEVKKCIADGRYGVVKHQGRRMVAHKFVWMFTKGLIPSGSLVLHGCDNPRCVNINHLHLGSASQNMIERSQRGRVVGFYGKQKIFAQMIPQILEEFFSGRFMIKDLARKYGVTPQYMGAIIKRKYWGHAA